ncbi:hypothetical protein [Kineosporia succinea]
MFAVGLLAPRLVEFAVSPEPSPVGDWARLVARLTGMGVVALIAGLCFVALAALIPGRWEGSGAGNLVASWITALWVTHWYPAGLPWQVVAMAAGGMALGATTAILQDACTISGVPFGVEEVEREVRGVTLVKTRERRLHLLPRDFRIRTASAFERHFIRFPVLCLVVWQSFELAADCGLFGSPFAL